MKETHARVNALRAFLLGSAAMIAAGCNAEAAGEGLATRPVDGSDFAPNSGPAAFTSWSALPVLAAGQYRMFAGYDRDEGSSYPLFDAGNKDFNNFLAVCGVDLDIAFEKSDDSVSCDPGLQGYVVAADDHGPGIVSRALFAVGTIDPLSGADVSFEDERVRVYVDDLRAPIYDGKLAAWRNGTAPAFAPPLTTWTSGSLVSYVPISYQSKLRIVLDNLSTTSAYYHRIDVLSSAEPSNFIPRPRAQEDIARALDGFRAQARASATRTTWVNQLVTAEVSGTAQLLDRQGPGTIDEIHLAIDSTDPADLRALVLNVNWDNEPSSSLDLPLAALFGTHQTIASFDTVPMSVVAGSDRTDLTVALPMPFASRAKVSLSNRGTKAIGLHAEIAGSAAVPNGDWGHLHAEFREQTTGFAPGERYVVADLKGRGKYVGTMMFVRGREDPETSIPSPFNFLEGDDRTIVDGVESKGTGTEDVFDGGWYFIDGRYDRPFTALIAKSSDDATDEGAVTMLRWNVLANAIPFGDAFRLDFETGANRPQTAISYSSVAFYYLR
ncbi:MAG: DUF2961 domain-containing protein [Polyangiaceae bacterium]